MSTRAGIVLIDENGDTIHFYRHSDGYPKGTLPTLRKFLNLVKRKQIRDNVNQASGWLVLIGAMEYNHVYGYICDCGAVTTKYRRNKKCKECGNKDDGGFKWGEIHLPAETIFNPSAKERKKSRMGWKVGAYEPTTNVKHHGDLEYVYLVNLKDRTILIHEGGSQNFSVKKLQEKVLTKK
jgi:hypothetical protein